MAGGAGCAGLWGVPVWRGPGNGRVKSGFGTFEAERVKQTGALGGESRPMRDGAFCGVRFVGCVLWGAPNGQVACRAGRCQPGRRGLGHDVRGAGAAAELVGWPQLWPPGFFLAPRRSWRRGPKPRLVLFREGVDLAAHPCQLVAIARRYFDQLIGGHPARIRQRPDDRRAVA